jgi:hypothetical protein
MGEADLNEAQLAEALFMDEFMGDFVHESADDVGVSEVARDHRSSEHGGAVRRIVALL